MSAFHLLLVDDEKDFIETLAKRLRSRNIEVNCVFSGEDALIWLEQGRPADVVFLDIRMPGMDGIDVLQSIKRRHPLVEVIMLTGHADVPSAVEALKHGAFDFLAKPCGLDELLGKAGKAAARKKAREAEILETRMKPFLSRREREQRISDILKTK